MKNYESPIGNKSYDVTVRRLDGRRTPIQSFRRGPTAAKPSGADCRRQRAVCRHPVARGPAAASVARRRGAVTSPMAGAIKAVLVKEADEVKQGQALIILEAMKMENQITAPVAGTVKSSTSRKAIPYRKATSVGGGVIDAASPNSRAPLDSSSHWRPCWRTTGSRSP